MPQTSNALQRNVPAGYVLDQSSLAANPHGEGTYKMVGPQGQTVQVPFSKVRGAEDMQYQVIPGDLKRYTKDAAAAQPGWTDRLAAWGEKMYPHIAAADTQPHLRNVSPSREHVPHSTEDGPSFKLPYVDEILAPIAAPIEEFAGNIVNNLARSATATPAAVAHGLNHLLSPSQWEIWNPDSWTPAGHQLEQQKEVAAALASGQGRVLAPGQRPPEPTAEMWNDDASEHIAGLIKMWGIGKVLEPALGLGSKALGVATAAGEEAALGKAASEGASTASVPIANDTVRALPTPAPVAAEATPAPAPVSGEAADASLPDASVDGETNATSMPPTVDGEAANVSPAPVAATGFSAAFSRIMNSLPQLELPLRAPKIYKEALRTIFQDDPNLRLATPGGVLEVHPADFFAQPLEIRRALEPNVLDPKTGRTLGEEHGLDIFQHGPDRGGVEEQADVPGQNDPETVMPEPQSSPEDLGQQQAQRQQQTQFEPGTFSIFDWTGYPTGAPRPQGTFRLLKDAEYEAARDAADKYTGAKHRADRTAHSGQHFHHVKPVKFGGTPTDPANIIRLSPSDHWKFNRWWLSLQRSIE